MVTGLQDGFSWKGVALGAIAGGVGGGLAKSAVAEQGFVKAALSSIDSPIAKAAVAQVAGNIITQGVSVAVGLQPKFSWQSVAQTALSAPLSALAGGAVGSKIAGANKDWADIAGASWAKFGSYVAEGLTTVGVRTALGGKFESTQVMADVFGNALGNAIVDSAARPGAILQQEVKSLTPNERAFYDAARSGGETHAEAMGAVRRTPGLDSESFNAALDSWADGIDLNKSGEPRSLADALPNYDLTSGFGVNAADTTTSVSTGAKLINPQSALKSLGAISPTAEQQRLRLIASGTGILFGVEGKGSYYDVSDNIIYLDGKLRSSEQAIQQALAHEFGHKLDPRLANLGVSDRETYIREGLADEGLAEINREVIRRETVKRLGGNGAFGAAFTDEKAVSLLNKGVSAFIKAGGIDATVETIARDVGQIFRQRAPSTNLGLTYGEYYGAAFDHYKETGSLDGVQGRWDQIAKTNRQLWDHALKQAEEAAAKIRPPEVVY